MPLRQLSSGEVIDGAVRAAVRSPALMLGWSLGVTLTYGIVALFLIPPAMITAPAFTQPLHGPTVGAVAVLVVLAGAMSLAVSGMQTVVVARMVIGHRISARQAWHSSLPSLTAIVRIVVILWAIISVLWGSYFLVGLAIWHPSLTGTAMIGFVAGGILLLLVTCWLVLPFLLSVPVAVLEQAGPVAALRRSYRLVKEHRRYTFGALAAAVVFAGVASFGIDIPFQLAAAALTKNPVHPPLTAIAVSIVGRLLVSALALPLLSGVLVLLYVDLRIRKEGIAETLRASLQRGNLADSEFRSVWRPPSRAVARR